MSWHVVAFYQFAELPDFADFRSPLLDAAKCQDVWGTILLSPEGANGTISGPTREACWSVLEVLTRDSRFDHLTVNESVAEEKPFQRRKIKLKKEIISIRNSLANPLTHTGEHVSPEEWDQITAQDDVILLDTRNDYEVELGTFRGAIDPKIATFGEFPNFVEEHLADQKDKTVAMFCTGGIRCEKASAYMLSLGFKRVVQLKGGILSYLRETPAEQRTYDGACYVFDERIAVN